MFTCQLVPFVVIQQHKTPFVQNVITKPKKRHGKMYNPTTRYRAVNIFDEEDTFCFGVMSLSVHNWVITKENVPIWVQNAISDKRSIVIRSKRPGRTWVSRLNTVTGWNSNIKFQIWVRGNPSSFNPNMVPNTYATVNTSSSICRC